MIYEKALLNKRYRDDGKLTISLSSPAVKSLDDLRKAIRNGEIIQEEHKQCPLCGFERALLIAEKDRLGIFTRTVVCEGCGLVFNDSYFNETSAKIFYQKYWTGIQWNDDPVKNFQNRIKPDAYSWKRFAFINLNLKDEVTSIKTVFEIGCGDGCNLLPFYFAGKDVCGCDFDERCLDMGRGYGLNLLLGDISVLEAQKKTADLIILSHVLEHFIDLNKALSRLRNLLSEGGYIYIEVPGIFNCARTRKKSISEDGYSSTNNFLAYLQCTHNYCFHLDSLVHILKKNGFELSFGDEWVRAIFKLTSLADLSSNEKVTDLNNKNLVMNHLKEVEASYNSISNYPFRLIGKVLGEKHKRKLSRYFK